MNILLEETWLMDLKNNKINAPKRYWYRSTN